MQCRNCPFSKLITLPNILRSFMRFFGISRFSLVHISSKAKLKRENHEQLFHLRFQSRCSFFQNQLICLQSWSIRPIALATQSRTAPLLKIGIRFLSFVLLMEVLVKPRSSLFMQRLSLVAENLFYRMQNFSRRYGRPTTVPLNQ